MSKQSVYDNGGYLGVTRELATDYSGIWNLQAVLEALSSVNYLTARYIKWEITGKVSNSTVYCQISEFKLQLDSVDISMSGATASSSDSYVVSETPTQLIDGSTTTKLNFDTLPTVSVTIDMGTATNFNGYDWATGGDTATYPERNPDDWNIYISNDGTNWTLVDTVTNASATTSNQTFTGPYTITV